MKKNTLAYVLIGVAIIVIGTVIVWIASADSSDNSNMSSGGTQNPATASNAPATEVVFEGVFECLRPLGEGPHSLDCAMGLHTDSGSYGLRSDKDPQILYNIPMGNRIRVTGTLTEEASTTHEMSGVIRIEKAEKL